MSQKGKFKIWHPFSKPEPQVSAAREVSPKDRVQVEQLVASGNLVRAVEIAKQIHKQVGSPASEELLVSVQSARIISLAERNLDVEAKALLELVQARHPSARDRLREVAATLQARGGGVEGLLALLADPALPAEKRVAIEARIRDTAVDPAVIAGSAALEPGHPLRVAAAAVARALEAVTSGPVAAEALSLPEISRHSPMAPWKMFVRALQAFYAHEDALCEKYLAAIEPSAAAARLVPAVRAMLGQKQKLTPAAELLMKQTGGSAVLRTTLASLDQAFDKKNHALAVQEIGRAVALCKEACPDLLERLKQHISVRALLAGAKADRVAEALGGPPLRNAHFWRLLARAYEETHGNPIAIPIACSLWEEFRRHAVHEKWFPASGPEMGALYLHMADLWRRVSDDDLGEVSVRFAAGFEGNRVYYSGQPPQIRALMLPPSPDLYYLDPGALGERACKADPCTENFQHWLKMVEWDARRSKLVAERWTAALPQDIPPVLYLMQAAEKSNALQKAFKLMEQAERLDGLNAEVRRARLRLLVSLATRHLQQKKVHLAEPELLQMEALPQAQLGDRPALIAALRWVYWTLSGDASRADAARATAAGLLGGEEAAQILVKAVAEACKLKGAVKDTVATRAPLAAAFGRACALGEDMGVKVDIPRDLSGKLVIELRGKEALSDAVGLAALGEAALRVGNFELAYAVSRAGLNLAQDRWAEFLFLRARCLPEWEDERQGLCAAAASELARRQRDADLLHRIGEWREGDMDSFGPDETDVAMTTQQIDDVVRAERKQKELPEEPEYMDDMDDMDDYDEVCNCPSCRARRSSLPPELQRMMEELGPEEMMRALEDIIGGGPPKRRKARSRAASSDDDMLF